MDTLELVLNKKIKGVATGFKRAYSNGDGTYTVEFIDGTKITTNYIKGDKGDKGDKGEQGEQGLQGLQGIQGERGVNGVGITEITKQGTTGLKDTYIITFSDGSQTTYEVTNGANVTKTSQLTNDSNFIDRLVTNLVNYYTKSEVYTKEQIDELMRNVGAGLGIAIVDVLPSSDISTTTIYLVANGESNYIQYMYIAESWANLGSTTVDLTNYYTKEQIDNLFLGYVTSEVFQTALADYAKIEALGKVAFSNSYNDLDDLPEIPSTEGFMKGRQMLGEVDLNECVTEGTFTVTASSANLPNIPIYGTYVDLQVLSIETVVSQIVRLIYNGEPMMWSRCKIIDTWTDWVHAISSDMASDVIDNNPKSYPTTKAVYDAIDGVNADLSKIINFKGYNNTLMKADLNECKTVGSYVVLEDCDNLPYNNAGWFFMNVYGGGNGGTVQEVINNYNNEKLYRTFNGFDWTSWHKLATVDNLGENLKIKEKSNADECIPSGSLEEIFYVTISENSKAPTTDRGYMINSFRRGNYVTQYAYGISAPTYAQIVEYYRKGQFANGVWTFGDWRQLATMDSLNVQEEDIATTAGFTIHASKSGNVVHLTFSGTTNVAFTSSEAKVIATLPEKYRPHRQVYDRIGVSASGNMYITVYNDGRVSMGYFNYSSGSNLNCGYMYML